MKEKCDDENGSVWHEGYQPYEDMKWALLMRAVDTVNFHVLDTYNRSRTELPSANLGAWGHTVRPNGGEWDLLGLEEYHGNRPAFVGLHGCTSNATKWPSTPSISGNINLTTATLQTKRRYT